MKTTSLMVSNSYLETLPTSVKDFIVIKMEEPYNSLPEDKKKLFCVDLITLAFAETGVSKENLTEDILRFQALNQLYVELKGKFGFLTCKEIQKAFYLGVRNEFGQYMGLNGVTYNKFLKGFISMPERINAMKELNKITDKPTEMIYTEEQKEDIMTTSLLNTFYEYKNGKPLDSFCWRLYDYLVSKLGVKIILKSGKEIQTLVADEVMRQKIKSEAKEDYEKYIRNYSKGLRFSGKHEEARNILKILDDLSNNRSYENYQKKHALKYYFDCIIQANTDLKDLLTKK